MATKALSSSFRDPSGFVYKQDGLVYRTIKNVYKEHYDYLNDSGLFKALTNQDLLIPHKEVEIGHSHQEDIYKTIEPELIPFISYPYEWSFSQLKHAALLTLKIQKIALECNMSLKDSSAYNIQFQNTKPIFIDTLSFEKYVEGIPWIGYKQFCEHFLAPLVLMSKKDIRLSQLLKTYIDGIPLDLASSLLPLNSYINPSLLIHIHLHSKTQKHFESNHKIKTKNGFSKYNFLALIDNLESTINKLQWRPICSVWSNYYENTNYTIGSLNHKIQLVSNFLQKNRSNVVIDLGANDGLFSRIASQIATSVISFDVDPSCVEKNYLLCLKKKTLNILPLILDLINPSPAIGWANEERLSLRERFNADTLLALALIHHLVISNNLSFYKIADYFSRLTKSLIIEFIPKTDIHLQKLIINRKDIFEDYSQITFEKEFNKYFIIRDSVQIADSERVLYNMETRKP